MEVYTKQIAATFEVALGFSTRFERFTFFKPPALPEVYDLLKWVLVNKT
jgi:hypothetical protein